MGGKRKVVGSEPSRGSPEPSKRQRVSRACDQCRTAREKCDGVQPHCAPCVDQGRSCTYNTSPKKRGVQTGYIRTLELTLAWVLEKVPDSETALDSLFSHETAQGRNPLLGKDKKAVNRLNTRWRKSRANKEIEKILSSGDVTFGPSPASAAEDSSDSDADPDTDTPTPSQSLPSRQVYRPFSQGSAAPVVRQEECTTTQLQHAVDAQSPFGTWTVWGGTVRQPVPSAYVLRIVFLWANAMAASSSSSASSVLLFLESVLEFTEQFGDAAAPSFLPALTETILQHCSLSTIPDRDREKWNAVQGRISRIWAPLPQRTASTSTKLPSNHWRLLDVYFAYTHCWLPILEKQEILKAAHSYQGRQLSLTADNPISAVHAELWSALALASFQNAASSDPSPSDPHADPQSIYATARSLIPSEEGLFRIQHVRALLLLSLVNLGGRNTKAAGILSGLASRILLTLELDGPDPTSAHQVKRAPAFLACHILEVFVSMRCGGCPSIGLADLGDQVSEDGLDEWERWAACEGFNGGGSIAADSSRSPAHSLSTFVQLGNISKVLDRYLRSKDTPPLSLSATPMRTSHGKGPVVLSDDSPLAFAAPTPSTSTFPPSVYQGEPGLYMPNTYHQQQQQQGPALFSPTDTVSTFSSQLNQQLRTPLSFPAPIDYEELLEHISSIDCADTVDADPQFMTNLGFTPGCSLSEILAQGYGAV